MSTASRRGGFCGGRPDSLFRDDGLAIGASGAEDLRLLGAELLVGEHAAVVQLTQFGELVEHVILRRRGGGRGLFDINRLRRLSLLRIRRLVLLRPTVPLATRNTITHRGCGPRNRGGPRNTTKKSHDCVVPSYASSASSRAKMAWTGMRPLATSC